MDFAHSPRTTELLERLSAFQEREIAPREEAYHRELLASADPWTMVRRRSRSSRRRPARRACGTCSCPRTPTLAGEPIGAGLSNVEYAPLAERWAAR